MITPAQIQDDIQALRQTQADVLGPMTQAEIVTILAEWACRWSDDTWVFRREAEALTEPFPFSHVRVSLEGLLPSLTEPELYKLIASEGVQDAHGVAVAGHVVAGNTPLLSWVSVLRGLVMRSASLVKLPSGGAGDWGRLFVRSLADVAPSLAACVRWREWPGGTNALDSALCAGVDLLMAYGNDETLDSLRALTPKSTPFVGYGHAISFGLVRDGADYTQAAAGFAKDVLLYDGGGCLSVRTIYVQGDQAAAKHFGECLPRALEETVARYGIGTRTAEDVHRHESTRVLETLWPGAAIWKGPERQHTVLLWPERPFRLQPGAGIVCVQAWPKRTRFLSLFAPVLGHVQGCAIAGPVDKRLRGNLKTLGVSYVCTPGEMQAPPFGWRQNRKDVLRTFLPPN